MKTHRNCPTVLNHSYGQTEVVLTVKVKGCNLTKLNSEGEGVIWPAVGDVTDGERVRDLYMVIGEIENQNYMSYILQYSNTCTNHYNPLSK